MFTCMGFKIIKSVSHFVACFTVRFSNLMYILETRKQLEEYRSEGTAKLSQIQQEEHDKAIHELNTKITVYFY